MNTCKPISRTMSLVYSGYDWRELGRSAERAIEFFKDQWIKELFTAISEDCNKIAFGLIMAGE